MSAISELKAVLLAPNEEVAINGSDEDRQIIARTLAEIEKQIELLTYEVLRLRRTGLKDIDGNEFCAGDKVRLDYETVHLEGVVRQASSGEWELYENEHSHVGLLHNQGRIRKIGE